MHVDVKSSSLASEHLIFLIFVSKGNFWQLTQTLTSWKMDILIYMAEIISLFYVWISNVGSKWQTLVNSFISWDTNKKIILPYTNWSNTQEGRGWRQKGSVECSWTGGSQPPSDLTWKATVTFRADETAVMMSKACGFPVTGREESGGLTDSTRHD